MPHIIVECSDNVRARTDLPALVARAHAAALGTGIFPEGGIRTRVAERIDYLIADSNPDNAFVHVVLRIATGRDLATKQRAAEAVFNAVCDQLAPVFEKSPLAISLELQEIDPGLSYRKNNLHDYVALRKTHA